MATTITTPIGVILKNLIVNKRLTKEDFIEKLNVFYTYNQITESEYQELMLLVNSTFGVNSTTTTDKPVDTTTTN